MRPWRPGSSQLSCHNHRWESIFAHFFAFSPSFYKAADGLFHFSKSMSCNSCRLAAVSCVIFHVPVVRFERSQPTSVDQAVISAAIDIADSVFAAAAGDNLADQLEIFILHGAPILAISLLLSGHFTFSHSSNRLRIKSAATLGNLSQTIERPREAATRSAP
jgi:hypothetical protein